MIDLTMPRIEQYNVLKALKGLPPEEYKDLCKTADQVLHWWKIRYLFDNLFEMLRCHFSGQGIKHLKLSKEERDIFGALLDRYLALYAVISWGWEYFVSEFEEFQLEEPFPFKAPGELLIRILENDAATFFSSCLSYSEFNPRTLSKYRTLETKQQHGKPLTASEERWLRKYESENKRLESEHGGLGVFWRGAIELCRYHSKEDATLQSRLKDFDKKQAEIIRLAIKYGHPKQGYKGHKWLNGCLEPLT